jgi:DNA-binding NarL/FixJ family response regulator
MARGLTDKEIANRLGISWKTVNTQVHTILLILQIGSRKQVAGRLTQFKQNTEPSPSGVPHERIQSE